MTNERQFRLPLGKDSEPSGSHAAGDRPSWTHYRVQPGDNSALVRDGFDPTLADALSIDGARPRTSKLDEGVLAVLRGINFNPGAAPEDMVSIRIYATPDRIVTVSPRTVRAIDELQQAFDAGRGKHTTGQVFAHLADGLVDRTAPAIDDLDEAIEDVQERILSGETEGLQRPLGLARRTIAMLRRHLGPQRDAIKKLLRDPPALLDEQDIASLRECADRATGFVEDLDALRERAMVLQDELNHLAATIMNRNTYLMGVVAAIFLPLSLLTGILGINVGGIPGTENPWAFWTVVAGMVVLAIVEVWWLRRRKVL